MKRIQRGPVAVRVDVRDISRDFALVAGKLEGNGVVEVEKIDKSTVFGGLEGVLKDVVWI